MCIRDSASTPLGAMALKIYNKFCEEGNGTKDFSAISKVMHRVRVIQRLRCSNKLKAVRTHLEYLKTLVFSLWIWSRRRLIKMLDLLRRSCEIIRKGKLRLHSITKVMKRKAVLATATKQVLYKTWNKAYKCNQCSSKWAGKDRRIAITIAKYRISWRCWTLRMPIN